MTQLQFTGKLQVLEDGEGLCQEKMRYSQNTMCCKVLTYLLIICGQTTSHTPPEFTVPMSIPYCICLSVMNQPICDINYLHLPLCKLT